MNTKFEEEVIDHYFSYIDLYGDDEKGIEDAYFDYKKLKDSSYSWSKKSKGTAAGIVGGGLVGLGTSHLATSGLRKQIKDLKAIPNRTPEQDAKLSSLRKKVAAAKVVSTAGGAVGGGLLGSHLGKKADKKDKKKAKKEAKDLAKTFVSAKQPAFKEEPKLPKMKSEPAVFPKNQVKKKAPEPKSVPNKTSRNGKVDRAIKGAAFGATGTDILKAGKALGRAGSKAGNFIKKKVRRADLGKSFSKLRDKARSAVLGEVDRKYSGLLEELNDRKIEAYLRARG
jgi:hypothetical protein